MQPNERPSYAEGPTTTSPRSVPASSSGLPGCAITTSHAHHGSPPRVRRSHLTSRRRPPSSPTAAGSLCASRSSRASSPPSPSPSPRCPASATSATASPTPSPGWLLAAAALQLASCLAFVAAFRGVFCHRLPWRMSYEVGMAAQGTNVLLPSGGAGGLALAAWALKRAGMPTERLARRTVAFYVLTSSVNFFTAVIAGLALAIGGGALLWTAGPAVAAALVIGAVLALPRLFTRPREGRVGPRARRAQRRDPRRRPRSPAPATR